VDSPLYCAVLTSAAGAVYTSLHSLCLFQNTKKWWASSPVSQTT